MASRSTPHNSLVTCQQSNLCYNTKIPHLVGTLIDVTSTASISQQPSNTNLSKHKLAQKSFASAVKTSSKSNTITETYIHNLVCMRWDLSFNLIPYMLQKNSKWRSYGHLNDSKSSLKSGT